MTITISQTTGTLNAANNYTLPITFSIIDAEASNLYIEWEGGITFGTLAVLRISPDASGNATVDYVLKAADIWNNEDLRNNQSINIYGRINSSTSQTLVLALVAPPKLTSQSITSSFPDGETFIETITTLSATATFEGLFGATISSVDLYLLPSSTPIAMTESSGVWNASTRTDRVGDLRVAFKATDSRGNIFQGGGKEITVKVWEDPVTNVDCFRCDSNGDRDMDGGYLSITGWATARPAELAISIFSVRVTDGDGNVIVYGQDLVNGTAVVVGNGSISPDKSYTLDFTIMDNASDYGGLPIVWTYDKILPSLKRVINVKDGGTGLAFGKLATEDALTDSAWDINTDGEYLVQGEPLVDTLPNASASVRGLVSTGAQTFAGTKQFNNGIYVTTGIYDTNTTANGASAPIFRFSDAPSANTEYGRMYLSYQNYGGRIVLRQYSGSSSARTSYREDYRLPVTDASRTGNADYDILTTKNFTIGEIGAFSIAASGNKTFTVANGTKALVMVCNAYDTAKALFILFANNSGSVSAKAVASGTSITTTVGTNSFKIANSSNTAVSVHTIVFGGSMT